MSAGAAAARSARADRAAALRQLARPPRLPRPRGQARAPDRRALLARTRSSTASRTSSSGRTARRCGRSRTWTSSPRGRSSQGFDHAPRARAAERRAAASRSRARHTSRSASAATHHLMAGDTQGERAAGADAAPARGRRQEAAALPHAADADPAGRRRRCSPPTTSSSRCSRRARSSRSRSPTARSFLDQVRAGNVDRVSTTGATVDGRFKKEFKYGKAEPTKVVRDRDPDLRQRRPAVRSCSRTTRS